MIGYDTMEIGRVFAEATFFDDCWRDQRNQYSAQTRRVAALATISFRCLPQRFYGYGCFNRALLFFCTPQNYGNVGLALYE